VNLDVAEHRSCTPSPERASVVSAHCKRRSGRRAASAGLLAALLGLLLASPASAEGPASNPQAAAFEVEFLTMMIDHHQMAVDTSGMCLEKAVHEDLLELCDSIMTTQAAEIEQMQAWLADWYGIEHEPSMDDPGHHQQMARLGALSGSAFEVAFLEMMTEHHAIAVAEGLECLPQAGHSLLRRLCAGIAGSQTRESIQMQVWLCRWFGECGFRNPLAA